MMHRSAIPTSAFALAALLATPIVSGCAQNQQVGDWKQSVEQYFTEQANYDLASLGDVHARDGHRIFATLGHEHPDQGSDAVGVLVGRHDHDGQPWLIFLVGEVQQRQLQSSRLVAISQNQANLLWRLGPTSASATEAYREHQRTRYEGRVPYAGFPDEADAFELTAEGAELTLTERHSAATWSLTLDHVAD